MVPQILSDNYVRLLNSSGHPTLSHMCAVWIKTLNILKEYLWNALKYLPTINWIRPSKCKCVWCSYWILISRRPYCLLLDLSYCFISCQSTYNRLIHVYLTGSKEGLYFREKKYTYIICWELTVYIQLYLFTILYSHWIATNMVKYLLYLVLFVYNWLSVCIYV